jgi:hypothetical protein
MDMSPCPSFREWLSKADFLLCRAVDVTKLLKARDRQALELQKEQVQHISVAANDILTLNVGGTLLCTNRSTLTQVSAQTCELCCGICDWICRPPMQRVLVKRTTSIQNSLEHRLYPRVYYACCLCIDSTMISGAM